MAAARPLRLVIALFAVLLGATACLDANGPVTPAVSGSASASAEPSSVSTPPTVGTTTTTSGSAYPATARLYAEAVLLAWRTGQFTRVGDLATPSVQSQLQTTGNVEPNWTYTNCQGAAGSSYCQFINADGDAITIRLDNQLLGKAHATTEVKLDQTTYSNNAVEYVKAFIEAWRTANSRRMATLANQTEVEYFTHYTPPGTYSTCATLSSGTAMVRVFNSDGLNYTLTVSVATLGSKHAITGHAASPATCS